MINENERKDAKIKIVDAKLEKITAEIIEMRQKKY